MYLGWVAVLISRWVVKFSVTGADEYGLTACVLRFLAGNGGKDSVWQ